MAAHPHHDQHQVGAQPTPAEQGAERFLRGVVRMYPPRGLAWPSFRKAFKRPTPPRGG